MLFSPACERNQGPILAVLNNGLPPDRRMLEISSGSAQHAVHFCRQRDHLTLVLQWR